MQFCRANQGPCFGAGGCENFWKDNAFNCPGGAGKSLWRQGFRIYGDCEEAPVDYITCKLYTWLACSWWKVYVNPGCNGFMCNNVGTIVNKCLP